MVQTVPIWEYMQNRKESDVLVDLRDERVYQLGTLPGAVNIPLSDIRRLYSLPHDKRICVYCQAGEISGQIAQLLADAGYDVFDLAGGYREYVTGLMSAEAT